MFSKKIFNKFIGTVLVEMDKALAANLKEIEMEIEKCASGSEMKHVELKSCFEWRSLGHAGAKGVAEHLQEKHRLESSPTVVVVGGEEEVQDGKKPKTSVFSVSHERFRHEFWVEESRYRYVRSNGKSKVMFKQFSAMRTAFWRDYDKRMAQIDKRNKAKATKDRDNVSHKGYLQKLKELEEAKEKEDEQYRANPPQEMPPPPPSPEKTSQTETGEAGDATAATGDANAEASLPEKTPPTETGEAGDASEKK